jgi:hypothetical protein
MKSFIVVALGLFLGLAGCSAGGAYRGAGSTDAYISPLPPALQGTDPALRQWYTAPYFNPYEMP